MLLVSASATMNLRCWRSMATGNMRKRRAISRGSVLSADGSTMMWPRSTDCRPSFSDSASRSVASDTKPSCTRRRPTGTCDFVCSRSAILSWSSVRMPWSIRIWPMWRLACGLAGEFMRAPASLAELRRPAARAPDIEARGALLGEGDRLAVVLEREAGLAHLVEAHRKVEGEIGVFRIRRERLEVLLLRLGPAALLRELVAEREVQYVRPRIGGKQALYAALRGERVEAARPQGDQPGVRMRVVRVGSEQAQISRLRRLVAPGAHVDRRKPEQRIAVARVLAQRAQIVGAGAR